MVSVTHPEILAIRAKHNLINYKDFKHIRTYSTIDVYPVTDIKDVRAECVLKHIATGREYVMFSDDNDFISDWLCMAHPLSMCKSDPDKAYIEYIQKCRKPRYWNAYDKDLKHISNVYQGRQDTGSITTGPIFPKRDNSVNWNFLEKYDKMCNAIKRGEKTVRLSNSFLCMGIKFMGDEGEVEIYEYCLTLDKSKPLCQVKEIVQTRERAFYNIKLLLEMLYTNQMYDEGMFRVLTMRF